jgi:hypothetical protein
MSRKNNRDEWYFEPRHSIRFWEGYYEEYSDSDSIRYAHDAGIEPDEVTWKVNL